MVTRGRYLAQFPRGAVVHFTAGVPNAENTVAGGIRNRHCFFTIGPDGQVIKISTWTSGAITLARVRIRI